MLDAIIGSLCIKPSTPATMTLTATNLAKLSVPCREIEKPEDMKEASSNHDGGSHKSGGPNTDPK